MFKNLRTGTKLVVLCSAFVVLVGVTTYGLVREKRIAIDFAQKELVGTRYLTTVHAVYATILAELLNNAPIVQPPPSIDDILKSLAGAQHDAGDALHTAELEQALSAALREYGSGKTKGDNIDARVLDVLAKARNLVARSATTPTSRSTRISTVITCRTPSSASYPRSWASWGLPKRRSDHSQAWVRMPARARCVSLYSMESCGRAWTRSTAI
jgi:hypothetical protein